MGFIDIFIVSFNSDSVHFHFNFSITMPESEVNSVNALAEKFQRLAKILCPSALEEKVRIEYLEFAAVARIKHRLSVQHIPNMEVSTCVTICLHGELSVASNADATSTHHPHLEYPRPMWLFFQTPAGSTSGCSNRDVYLKTYHMGRRARIQHSPRSLPWCTLILSYVPPILSHQYHSLTDPNIAQFAVERQIAWESIKHCIENIAVLRRNSESKISMRWIFSICWMIT